MQRLFVGEGRTPPECIDNYFTDAAYKDKGHIYSAASLPDFHRHFVELYGPELAPRELETALLAFAGLLGTAIVEDDGEMEKVITEAASAAWSNLKPGRADSFILLPSTSFPFVI